MWQRKTVSNVLVSAQRGSGSVHTGPHFWPIWDTSVQIQFETKGSFNYACKNWILCFLWPFKLHKNHPVSLWMGSNLDFGWRSERLLHDSGLFHPFAHVSLFMKDDKNTFLKSSQALLLEKNICQICSCSEKISEVSLSPLNASHPNCRGGSLFRGCIAPIFLPLQGYLNPQTDKLLGHILLTCPLNIAFPVNAFCVDSVGSSILNGNSAVGHELCWPDACAT